MSRMWTTTEHAEVVVATYRNPPVNYYTDAAVDELQAMVREWTLDAPRVIILTGEPGGPFITHFDVEEILAGVQDPERIVRLGPVRNDAVNAVLTGLTRLRAPVIAALNGDAMGFGFELALACDLRIGQSGDHRYGLPEVKLGIMPGSGGTQRLSRLIGLGPALDLVLRARILLPDEALRVGLLTHLSDDARAASMQIANEICSMDALAVAMAKRALWQGFDAPLAAALTIESDANQRAKLGAESQRSLRRYVDLPMAQRRDWLETWPAKAD